MPALHIPGYNYCGPGTWDFTKKPTNALDRACRDHDLSYKRTYYRNGKKVHPYLNYVSSDEVLRKKAKRIGGLSGNFIYTVFSAKKLVAPIAHQKPITIRSETKQKLHDSTKELLDSVYIKPKAVGNKLPLFLPSETIGKALTDYNIDNHNPFIEKSHKIFQKKIFKKDLD